MIIVEVPYRGISQEIVLYDIWDVKKEDIVLPPYVLSEDAGKYVLHTDGTNTLSKIHHKRGEYFNTTSGLFNRKDYLCLCRPRVRMSAYSGLLFFDEHIKLRRPNLRERQLADDFIENKFPRNRTLPKRCRLIVLTKLQEKMVSMGIDENYIVEKLKKEVDNTHNRGADRLEAIKILARIGGVEVGGLNTAQNKPPALFAQFNFNTIQDQRRNSGMVSLPDTKQLAEVIDVATEDVKTGEQ